jgi:hypothetical protein
VPGSDGQQDVSVEAEEGIEYVKKQLAEMEKGNPFPRATSDTFLYFYDDGTVQKERTMSERRKS